MIRGCARRVIISFLPASLGCRRALGGPARIWGEAGFVRSFRAESSSRGAGLTRSHPCAEHFFTRRRRATKRGAENSNSVAFFLKAVGSSPRLAIFSVPPREKNRYASRETNSPTPTLQAMPARNLPRHPGSVERIDRVCNGFGAVPHGIRRRQTGFLLDRRDCQTRISLGEIKRVERDRNRW